MAKKYTVMDIKSQDIYPLINKINEAMKARDWNAFTLSKKAGVSQPSVSRLLNGSSNIKVDTIYKILDCLDLLNNGPIRQDIRYPEGHKDIHELVEDILNSGDKQSIDAFKAGLEGIIAKMKYGDLERRIREMELIVKGKSNPGTDIAAPMPGAKALRQK